MQVTELHPPNACAAAGVLSQLTPVKCEKSQTAFDTLAAITQCVKRMAELDHADCSVPLARTRGSTFHRRSR
jgi:hypothetical protein